MQRSISSLFSLRSYWIFVFYCFVNRIWGRKYLMIPFFTIEISAWVFCVTLFRFKWESVPSTLKLHGFLLPALFICDGDLSRAISWNSFRNIWIAKIKVNQIVSQNSKRSKKKFKKICNKKFYAKLFK